MTVNVDAYLGRNKYEVDEGNPHIELVDHADPETFGRLVRACPAALYKVDAEGNQVFDCAGCLECGTCRAVAPPGTLTWHYPRGGYGVTFREG
ncbi:MAG: 4Fe-4S dicluster domain-containing protein [Cellulomonas sp.]|nr:4Fe-4S dicluster domain-containing protein [Cellulomonas sp.]